MNSTMPILSAASTLAPEVDNAMVFLLLICGVTFLLVSGLILIFCIRYRKDSRHSRELRLKKTLALEWSWTLVTLVVFLALFVWGIVVYFAMHVAPKGANEISVVGKQWMWKFQHSNGRRELNELHIPIGQPILLVMTSQDVIHSLFVPEFRLKQDVLPGRYTKTWLEATKVGEYRIYCTQYCGTMHAQMLARVFVLSTKEYEQWLEEKNPMDVQINNDPVSRGEKIFSNLGCIGCHSENSGFLGPSLKGVFNSKVKLTTGELVLADENYIRESILYPDVKIVFGYKPLMPSFMGRISEIELLDLLAYIKSLSGESKQ